MNHHFRPIYRRSDYFADRQAPHGTYIVVPATRRERRAIQLAAVVAFLGLFVIIWVAS